MQIEFNGIETSYVKTDKGGYSKAVVSFTNNESGRPGKKTLTSFANPKVFDTLKEAKPGTLFNITEKQNGEFTNWAAADQVDSASPAPAATSSSPAKATVSQYETRDERNSRQRLIVRQSCLKDAIEHYAVGAKQPADPETVKRLAEELTAWVYESPDLFEAPNDIDF